MMAYAYQQMGPYTCNNMEHQLVTFTAASGMFISIGVQIIGTVPATSFYPIQMYIKDATTAVVEVVNTNDDLTASQPYASWSAWLIIDTSGSANVSVSVTAATSTAVN